MTSDKGILIKNIYYMLAYAAQNPRFSDVVDIDGENFDEIHDLFAWILSKGISYQLKQGLHKAYINRTESKISLRGKLDINGTIDKTCNNGGCLQIVMQKPRKNAVKLLLLMDSGGTMIPYSSLLNDLFQAIHKSNHYKDVKSYYFHNCIYLFWKTSSIFKFNKDDLWIIIYRPKIHNW